MAECEYVCPENTPGGRMSETKGKDRDVDLMEPVAVDREVTMEEITAGAATDIHPSRFVTYNDGIDEKARRVAEEVGAA